MAYLHKVGRRFIIMKIANNKLKDFSSDTLPYQKQFFHNFRIDGRRREIIELSRQVVAVRLKVFILSINAIVWHVFCTSLAVAGNKESTVSVLVIQYWLDFIKEKLLRSLHGEAMLIAYTWIYVYAYILDFASFLSMSQYNSLFSLWLGIRFGLLILFNYHMNCDPHWFFLG